jgi:AAA+ superfamily predicted ATPase
MVRDLLTWWDELDDMGDRTFDEVRDSVVEELNNLTAQVMGIRQITFTIYE